MATQNIPWSYDTVMKLIDLYQERVLLWDTSLDDYRNRTKKSAAWQDIADAVNMDKQVVEKKVRMLVGQYRRELVKEASGVPSRWFAFAKLSFLGSHDPANSSAGDQLNHDNTDEKSEEGSNLEYNSDHNEEISRKRQREENDDAIPKAHRTEYLSLRHRRSEENEELSRRRRREEALSFRQRGGGETVDAPRKRLREDDLPISQLQRPSPNNGDVYSRINDDRISRDEHSVFGEHVANKMRNITNRKARATTEYLINKILYNAQMGNYDRTENRNMSNRGTIFVNSHPLDTSGIEDVIDDVTEINEDIDPVAIENANSMGIKIKNDKYLY